MFIIKINFTFQFLKIFFYINICYIFTISYFKDSTLFIQPLKIKKLINNLVLFILFIIIFLAVSSRLEKQYKQIDKNKIRKVEKPQGLPNKYKLRTEFKIIVQT